MAGWVVAVPEALRLLLAPRIRGWFETQTPDDGHPTAYRPRGGERGTRV